MTISRVAALLGVVVLAVSPCVQARATPGHVSALAAVRSWGFAIGSNDLKGDIAARYGRYDLIVVDGEEVTAAQVATLRACGLIVLAYLDVGTIERGRSWYQSATPYKLNYWTDWGEWYANVAAPRYRNLIGRRVAPGMLAKGVSGLFLDNVDMIDTHRRDAKGMLALVGTLASLVHNHHGYLFAQNGEGSIGPMLPFLDGWNREDVSFSYDFSTKRYVAVPPADTEVAIKALTRIHARGLVTLATDYVASGDLGATRKAVSTACAAAAVPFVGDIRLSRIPADPVHC